MTKKAWKAIAIGEFIGAVIVIALILFFVAYKTGLLNEGVKGALQVIANILYMIFLFGGGTGWMLLVGLWKGVD